MTRRRTHGALGTRRSTRINFGDFVFRATLLFGVIVIIALWYFFSPSSPFFHKSAYYFAFKNANGLDIDSKVLINGEHVGQVQKIEIDNNRGIVYAKALIPQEISLPKGISCGVVVRSLIGEKALNISYTDSSRGKGVWKVGDTINSSEFYDPTQVMAYYYALKTELDRSVACINQINGIWDSSAKHDGDQLVIGLQKTGRHLSSLLKQSQSNLISIQSQLRQSKDTALVISHWMHNHPLWQGMQQTQRETANLIDELDKVKNRDLKIINDNQLKSALTDSATLQSIDSTYVHLQKLGDILRQSKLEFNPDFF